MRILVHKLAVVLVIFGLLGGSMAVASGLRINNNSHQLSNVSDMAGVLVSPGGVNQSCDSHTQMPDCNMTHPPIVSIGMNCCGCFPSVASNLCFAPAENKVNAFGRQDIKGNSRTPSSLLKPPRA
jgi:hypothetical protein